MYTIDEIQKKINDYIDNQKFDGEPKELYAPIEYILRQGGKRLRPTLCLLACDLFGGNVEDCMVPAVAAEIFHNFTLVHDDIMDQAPLRRGMETIYKKWGSDVAILSGDTMMIKAFQYVLNTNSKYRYEVFAELCKVALEVCEGQQLDLNFETRDDVTLDEYLEMIRLKTAVLLGSVLKIGAIVAGADEESQKIIYDFGVDLGMAFQLQDDVLDCYADVEVFGKMTGGDISDNKKTYLYLYALGMAFEEDEKTLRDLFKMPKGRDEEKIKKVLEIYDKYAVKHEVLAEIEEMFNVAIMDLITKLDVATERKEVLLDYAKYLYNRNK
ncbi:MAG: polyprenyl synthetase family protein [Bacteroidales bacterium]|nr:polyprenyl synthetase family protein [Bacteroidales bacterium]MBR5782322.1 polyprenyl synthetase family protein [Bacteroidales bacterium]